MSLTKLTGIIPKHYVQADQSINLLNNYILADGFDFILDLQKSSGSRLVDARNGKSYIDFFTCFASIPIGINHPKLSNVNFIDYIGRAALTKPSNSDIYTEEYGTFVKTFFEVAVPKQYIHGFFIDGGALAVENSLKVAFDWKVRKNLSQGKGEKGHQIIHFKQAFHGRSGYTMSLTNTDPNKVLYYPKFDWPRITNPKIKFPLDEINLKNVIENEQKAIAEIKNAFLKNKDDIAAIIIEPIQGEGGDNHFRSEFLKELRKLADENEALLIFDEVQTGMGITGTFWAFQQLDVFPDIFVFGKKSQICGICATSKIDEVPDNVFKTSSRINSTWGGNLVDMVRATRYLEIIEEEKLLDNVKLQGKILRNELNYLQKQLPEIVSNVRNRGLFGAFDVSEKVIRDKFIQKAWSNGLIILPCGDHSVRFRPVLNIQAECIVEGFEIILKSLKEVI